MVMWGIKSARVPLQIEGLGKGSRGLLLMMSLKVLQFISSTEYVGVEVEEAGSGLGEFFRAMLRWLIVEVYKDATKYYNS